MGEVSPPFGLRDLAQSPCQWIPCDPMSLSESPFAIRPAQDPEADKDYLPPGAKPKPFGGKVKFFTTQHAGAVHGKTVYRLQIGILGCHFSQT